MTANEIFTTRLELENLLESMRDDLSCLEFERADAISEIDELEATDAPDEIIDEAYSNLDEITDEYATVEENIEVVSETIALLDKLESNFRFLRLEE